MSTLPIDRLNAALSGRYRIEKPIGEGGMATVFLADDIKHERKVALKVLKPELAAVVGGDRFLAEIKTTANLHHPHILPLFDSGEADSFLFYVMPYVDGETLGDRLKRERQLPVKEAVSIATAVASALQHAHDRGVIHRDIKPGNILLQDGQPVVSDFGIALAVGSAGGTRLTETGLSVGTPYYMSPEQATGDQVIGPSSDTFALACVLYEMLVGEPPYPGSTAQAVLGKIIQGAPVSATAVRNSIPVNVDAAIRKALEKLPADRFPGAQDFAKALADPGFRHGEAVGAGAAAGGGRWKVIAGLCAALAVASTGTAAWALTRDGSSAPSVERYGTPFLEGQEPLGNGAGNYAVSADGSTVVFVGPADQGGIQLWVRRWSDLQSTPIRGTEGGNQPAISTDGAEVAFHRNNEIHVVSIVGGPIRTLTRGIFPAWGEDGTVFATIGAVGLVSVPAGGGPPDTLSLLEEGDQNQYVTDVLPGGRGLLVVVWRNAGDQELRTLDRDTGEMSLLTPGRLASYVDSGHLVYLFDGSLVAAPFDPKAMKLLGPQVSLEPDVISFSVSRSGRLLYGTGTSGGTNRQLVWVTRSGEVTPVDPGWTFGRGDDNTSWSLSPDGTRIAIREQIDNVYDIWVKQLDDGPRSRLTFDDRADYYPEWTPDGESVMYVSGTPTGLDVYSRRADGTGEPEQLVDLNESVALAYYSPDMEWMILRTTTGAGNVFGRDILAMRPGVDSEPRRLLVGDYDESDPDLSPDGRWIAYSSNETGRYEVYVRPFPEVDSGRWQVSTQGGRRPLWARSGQEIFFRDANDNMVVAQVNGSTSAFVSGRSEILFGIPSDIEMAGGTSMPYDVSLDDQRFIMSRTVRDPNSVETGLPDFVLVHNFVEELKARVLR